MRLLLLLPAALAFGAEPLVRFNFDEPDLATGPDTFFVVQAEKGSVRLADEYRYSGSRSVRITAVAGSDFPELQGRFAVQRNGTLHFHFALLVATPQEELNIALAGPAHFSREKNGLAFWLTTRKGHLMQWSNGQLKELTEIRSFLWYVIDCLYNIAAGRYELTIRNELAPEPIVAVTGQPSVTNIPGSSIDRWSFVSNPFKQDSNVSYYIDDVELTATDAATLPPFVAPGRRQLFVDHWNDLRRQQARRPDCLPVLHAADLALQNSGEDRIQNARRAWEAGCAAARKDDRETALARFREARGLAPESQFYGVSVVLGLLGAGQAGRALEEWAAIESDWRGDWRHLLVSAWLGLARDDLGMAESLLESTAWQDGPGAVRLAEQYFAVLLWKGDWTRAQAFARHMVEAKERARWLEYAGDAAFFAGDLALAKAHYESAAAAGQWTAELRLADIAWKQGDRERERRYRERVYGHLRMER